MSLIPLDKGCILEAFQKRDTNKIKLGDDFPTKTADYAIIPIYVTLQNGEIVIPVVAMDGARFLYTFGENFGNMSLVGVVLHGSHDTIGEPVVDLQSWYAKNRISENPTGVNLSFGAYKTRVFVTNLEFSGADPNSNSQNFIISCYAAERPK